MREIYDRGYGRLFSNKVIFQQLIQSFVNEEWVDDLDFDTCERLQKSFIDKDYKKTESDVIYKVQVRGKDSYICILMEFQSTVQQFMAFRVNHYVGDFYMDYISSNRGVRYLPVVFPVVLYNGEEKWTAPTNTLELLDEPKLLGNFALNFRYFKIAINEYDKDELLRIRNIVSSLFLAESHYETGLLKEELIKLFENQEDKQAVSLFLNWFKQLAYSGRRDDIDYEALERIYKSKEEVRSMLEAAIERERKGWKEEGKREGKREGIRDVAQNMLARGMDISVIADITGLSEQEIVKLKRRNQG